MLFSASAYNGRVRFGDSAYYFKKQLFATALGLGVMYLISETDYHFLVTACPVAYLVLSMALSGGCFVCGTGNQWFQTVAEPWPIILSAFRIFKGCSNPVSHLADREMQKENDKGFGFMCRTMLTLLLPIVALVGSNNLSTAIIILGIGVIADFCFRSWLFGLFLEWRAGIVVIHFFGSRKLSPGTTGNLEKPGKI